MLVKDSGTSTTTMTNGYDTVKFNDDDDDDSTASSYSTVMLMDGDSVRAGSSGRSMDFNNSMSSSVSSGPLSRHNNPDPLDLDAPTPRKRRLDTKESSTTCEMGVQTDFPYVYVFFCSLNGWAVFNLLLQIIAH